MKRVIKLSATLLLAACASMASATSTYNVQGVFYEPSASAGDTVFNGTFEWDGTTFSNFSGTMNSSMFVQANTPNLTLNQNMIWNKSGNIVTASVFLLNNSQVFSSTWSGGGYDATAGQFPGITTCYEQGSTLCAQSNAYFTFSFDTAGGSVTPYGLTTTMQYGDCTALGMMSSLCMTGFGPETSPGGGAGSMGAYAQALNISAVQAVPVPTAAWLFGGALMSLFGANRRKSVLSA